MSISDRIPKHAIAMEHLERAMELYQRGDSYYSALHLGAAAEEILAVYARDTQISSTQTLKPSFDEFKEAVFALSAASSPAEQAKTEKWIHDRMTDAKNSVKHKAGRKDAYVGFDAKEEAYVVIDRAISTYFQLFLPLRLPYLPSIQDFDAKRRSERGAR